METVLNNGMGDKVVMDEIRALLGDQRSELTHSQVVGKVRALINERDKLKSELSRYSMSAGQADQRMAESKAVREVLGLDPDGDDVSPVDLVSKINEIKAVAASK